VTLVDHGLSSTAMVLAAGLGTRMRPLTERVPKPLIRVSGRTLLDHALDRLTEANVERAVVNVHWLADQIEAHLKERRAPQPIISDERAALLDSGGGVKKALPHLGPRAFLLINADTLWMDGARSNMRRLVEAWRPDQMDILLLLAATATSIGFDGKGDFAFSSDGRLVRRREREVVPFAYAGVAILKPGLFAESPDGPFSLNRLFDRAMESKRLFGVRLDGVWMHVGTPDAITEAEACLARSAA
jgi:MurNAc alpha-1-phosphate uridylyltransferase